MLASLVCLAARGVPCSLNVPCMNARAQRQRKADTTVLHTQNTRRIPCVSVSRRKPVDIGDNVELNRISHLSFIQLVDALCISLNIIVCPIASDEVITRMLSCVLSLS